MVSLDDTHLRLCPKARTDIDLKEVPVVVKDCDVRGRVMRSLPGVAQLSTEIKSDG